LHRKTFCRCCLAAILSVISIEVIFTSLVGRLPANPRKRIKVSIEGLEAARRPKVQGSTLVNTDSCFGTDSSVLASQFFANFRETYTAMERPLIAVVGDAKKTTNPDIARKAAVEIGSELAKRACRVLVYSTSSEYVEWEVVQGFLRTKVKKEPRSIEVRYPPELDGRFPGEKLDDPLFVRIQQGGDWEASIYPSFANLDGLVLIGGGYTTKIAGLLALGSKTPLITLGGMGGAAQKIWLQLKGDRNNTATDDDLNLMASQIWTENSAERFVAALLEQRRRKLEVERRNAVSESERHRKRVLTILGLIGCALLGIVLFALVESLQSQVPRWHLWILFGTPAIAGASGATIRVLWDNWQQGTVPLELRPVAMTIALGFWASGVAGVLFVLPQIWALGALNPAQATKLSGFAVPIGLIAGLTLDKVFPKLIKYQVPLENELLANPQTINAKS
jgi:hypothetical protein